MKLRNGSIIENARTAISTNSDYIPWPEVQKYYGGYIFAEDSEFLNNNRAVEFMSSIWDDYSEFSGCNFIGGGYQCTHWDNHGVSYINNYFGGYSRFAIFSSDATGVISSNDFINTSTNQFANGAINIGHTDEVFTSWQISNNDVYGGRTGIRFTTSNNVQAGNVYKNEFYCLRDLGVGYLDQSHYRVNENSFYRSPLGIGIDASNSGSEINKISRNWFMNQRSGMILRYDNQGLIFEKNGFTSFLASHRGIVIDGQSNNLFEAKVFPDQGLTNGFSASNCFNTSSNSAKLVNIGPVKPFRYHIKNPTPSTSCLRTINVNQVEDSAQDHPDIATGPSSITCTPPEPRARGRSFNEQSEDTESSRREIRNSDPNYNFERASSDFENLSSDIVELENSLLEKYDLAVEGEKIEKISLRSRLGSSIIFHEGLKKNHEVLERFFEQEDIKFKLILARNMIGNSEFQIADSYLGMLKNRYPELDEFVSIANIHKNYLKNGVRPSELELERLKSIVFESESNSGYAHAVYQNITFEVLVKEIELVFESVETEERSKNITSKVQISPNPFSNELFIKSNNLIKDVRIYNIQGDLVFSKSNVNSLETIIAGTELSDGMYVVKILFEDGKTENYKIAKTR